MADNVAITAGSGTTIATDDVSGVQYQRGKVAVGADGSATDVSSAAPMPTSDGGPNWTQVFGVSGARFSSSDASTAAAVTDAPTTGQKLVIDDIVFAVGSTAMQVDFQIETAATVFLTFYCAANTIMQFTPRGKFKLPTADKKLMVKASVAGNVAVTVWYHSES